MTCYNLILHLKLCIVLAVFGSRVIVVSLVASAMEEYKKNRITFLLLFKFSKLKAERHDSVSIKSLCPQLFKFKQVLPFFIPEHHKFDSH